jgi:bile acid:Na+ symporter, BASS family
MSAQHVFNAIFNGSLVIMLLALVASLGMTFSVAQIVAPLKRVWLLIGVIVLNLGLAPLIAIGVCHLFPLHSQAAIGVELTAMAAAGPACLKSCELAKRADLALAISFTIVLLVLDIVAAPLWAKAIVSGAKVSPWSILGDLLLLVLVPLVVGLILRSRYPEHRDRWKAGLEKASNIALVATIGFGLAANWKLVITTIGTWVIVATVVFVAALAVLGWLVAFRSRSAAMALSVISPMRFQPVGLVVISTVLHNQGAYLAPALVFALVDTLLVFLVGAEIGRYVTRAERKPAPGTPAPAAAGPRQAATTPRQAT